MRNYLNKMSIRNELNSKEREKFRKLLEVANSTQYTGEKEAALAAATRLANSKGMSLREAAGVSDLQTNAAKRSSNNNSFFQNDDNSDPTFNFSDMQSIYAEKKRFEQAKAEAIRRGLETEPDKKVKKRREYIRRKKKSSWRSRPDFIKILIRETQMSSKEIALTAGVSIHEVIKIKLLMRKNI